MLNSETHFSQVPEVNKRRSLFNQDHEVQFSLDSGKLVPVMCYECIPGGTYQLKKNPFVTRMSQPSSPTFGDIYQDIFYFFVPTRLLWQHAENFFARTYVNPSTGQYYYSPSTEYTIPQLIIDNPTATANNDKKIQIFSVADYFGLPVGVAGQSSSPGFSTQGVNALPFRAYAMIWNTYFRSQELQDPILINLTDSNHNYTDNEAQYGGQCLPVDKYHDYFTSCTKQPQRGPDVPIIAETVSVSGSPLIKNSGGSTITSGTLSANGSGHLQAGSTQAYLSGLSTTIQANIRDLQTAFAIQELYDRDNLYGGLYRDILRGQYGVIAPDSRLALPEFLGGFKTRLNIQQVLNQAESSSVPLGQVGAYSVTVNSDNNVFNYTSLEHGYLIGLTCIRSRNYYAGGIEKKWLRKNRTDFYFPALSGLPAMAVKKIELNFTGAPADDDLVFGYQENWADYKYMPNRVCALMRPQSQGGNLYSWNYASDFGTSSPTLNSDFIKFDKSVIDKTLLTTGSWSQQFICHMKFEFNAIIPMPVQSRSASLTHMW